jgi:LruC domain-containing protein
MFAPNASSPRVRAATPTRFELSAWLCAGLTLVGGLALPARAAADYIDTDGDGAPDHVDPFPCHWRRASATYAPAENQYGTLLYEDNWPAMGDLDFNDAVVAYNAVFYHDLSGRTNGARLTIVPRAVGAKIRSGLAVRLPFSSEAIGNVSATRSNEPHNVVLRPDGSGVVITLSDDLRAEFGAGDTFVNTTARDGGDAPTIVVDIDLTTALDVDVWSTDLDLFFFRSADPSHEVHGPRFRGTTQMNLALFGTADDASDGVRSFVDTTGMPFVLSIPAASVWPSERTPIDRTWPAVTAFVASGGASAADFYQQNQQGSGLWIEPAGLGTVPDAVGQCLMPACDDGVHNGTETDVDCGGGCGLCELGQACGANTDCASARCHYNVCSPGVSPDSDGDGLSDVEEQAMGTSPLVRDTDGDGIGDGLEQVMGRSPTVATPRPTSDATPISACGQLQAGRYVLTQDLQATGDCFMAQYTFAAVDIDCAGHTISGNGTGYGVNFSGYANNSTLRNCEIRGFQHGVALVVHNYDVTLQHMLLTHNAGSGLHTAHHNYRTRVADSRASYNGLTGLAFTDWAQTARVERTESVFNGGAGVSVDFFGGLFACSSRVEANEDACQLAIESQSTWSLECRAPAEAAGSCDPRPAGGSCGRDSDCQSNVCRANVCAPGVPSDADGDGLSDVEELATGSNPNALDGDGDGLSDGMERVLGTDPNAASARPASSGTPLSSCGRLTGGTYVLTQDLYASGECLRAEFTFGSPVVIRCDGHAIVGDGTGVGIMFYGHNYGGIVSDCEIRNFEFGIRAEVHNYDLTIERTIVHSNTRSGVYTGHHNYRTLFRDGRASMNGGTGIDLTDWASAASVRRSVVRDNRGYGLNADYLWNEPLESCGNVLDGNLDGCNLRRPSDASEWWNTLCFAEPIVEPACTTPDPR